MGALRDTRDQLVADLAPLGVPVHVSWPDAVVVPCAWLIPPTGGSYVNGGQGAGWYIVNQDIVLLVAHGDPDASLDALENMVETVIVNTVDWALQGVDPPAPTTVSEIGGEYLGAVVHLAKQIRIT